MRFDDNEIRDIMRYLEQGKPLPDKYRFLLFEDKREVELVWNGKTNEVCKIALPFQVIEQVDEPRAEKAVKLQGSLFDLDGRGRQLRGWTNKLIWGDNKLILSSLKNGPLREEIEKNGGIKLIYIDPPFDLGADFSMNIEIGDEEFTKEPSVLEELAYRDTWGNGSDSFIAMIYERLVLMRDLLTEDGSIYVHCDWRVSGYFRLVMDEIFGKERFKNEIVWQRDAVGKGAKKVSKQWSRELETLFWYSKSDTYHFEQLFRPNSELTHTQLKEFRYKEVDGRLFKIVTLGDYSQTSIEEMKQQNLIYATSTGKEYKKYYLDEFQLAIGSLWNDIANISHGKNPEVLDYPTQKPEKLLERIVNSSSNPGDIVADFFCGSGTTLAVAEKLGRKWIGSDLGKFAIHTTRKRMIGVQRELKKQDKDYRALEILNLGKYERQHYIGVNPNLREQEQEAQQAQKEKDFLDLILRAYHADLTPGFKTIHGRKNNRLVVVGPVNMPVSRLFIEEVLTECLNKRLTKVDVLAFEFEMGLFPNIQEDARAKGVDLVLKYIPRDVFDKRAIEKNQVVFHDVSYIEIKPHIKGSSLAIELTDFSVFYNQDSIAHAEAVLKNGGTKIVVEQGQIVKISKDKNGITTRQVLTKKWTDWVDYWAVDFDFEAKKEIVRRPKEKLVQPTLDGKVPAEQTELYDFEEEWTGDYIFENEWQSFRTKKNRSLELTSVFRECKKGRRKIAIKVVDIFGNDTMKVIEITI